MKLIGSGSFSKVYRQGNDKYVHIRTNDNVKECMAMGWFPTSHNFPTIKESNKQGYDYMMRYYPKQSSLKNTLKPSEWAKYQELRKLWNDNRYADDYNDWYAAFKTIKNRTLRGHMIAALDSLANFGSDIGFEISPRNVAVSPAGNLVLRDVFFFHTVAPF